MLNVVYTPEQIDINSSYKFAEHISAEETKHWPHDAIFFNPIMKYNRSELYDIFQNKLFVLHCGV